MEDDSTQVPMSAAFLADWAKGHAPQRPVWLTTRSTATPKAK